MNAKTTKRTFSRETEVSAEIRASASEVWSLLTHGDKFPTWTTTVLSLEGDIAVGNTIALRSSLAPNRTFKLKVKAMEPSRLLVWGDAMGTRTYRVAEKAPNLITFSMHEKIGGPLFPLFARMIPSFDESFNTFVADLKRAAEGKPGEVAS